MHRVNFALSVGLLFVGLLNPVVAFANDAQAAASMNSFGLTFYKKVAEKAPGKNVVLSPLSLYSCLLLVANGANGPTAAEMSKTLALSKDGAVGADDYQKLMALLQNKKTTDAVTDSASEKPKSNADQPAEEAVKKESSSQTSKAKEESEKPAPESEPPKPEAKSEPKSKAPESEPAKSAPTKPEPSAEAPQTPVQTPDTGSATTSDSERSLVRTASDGEGSVVKPSTNTIESCASVWLNGTQTLTDDFKGVASKMGAEVQSVDFSDSKALDSINGWVSGKTNGKIKEIVSQLNNSEKVLLATAAYMKSQWAKQFDKSLTKNSSFFNDVPNKEVAMMHSKGTFLYFADQTVQLVYLPYEGFDTGLLIALPSKKSTLAAWSKNLSPNQWDAYLNGLQSQPGKLALPRFVGSDKVECKNYLVSMGMKTTFSEQADFSKLITTGSTQLSDVLHKTFIKVDEEGTEAAAATTTVSRGLFEPGEFDMTVDRPFFFAVVNRKAQNAILFLGQVNDPSN